jgi:predicted RNA binding protein YcfA (HicA-like mRNA interferase family)/NCAIR mutase (PurE)-related protein
MNFKDFLTEKTEKHGVLAFGRMSPPTIGHEALVNKVKDVAKTFNGSHHIVLSHTNDPKKNPLTPQQKLKHAKRFFPNTNLSLSTPDSPNFLAQAAKLHKSGVTHLHMVAGSDRVDEYYKLLHKYNGVKGAHGQFDFRHIKVHSAGERDPDAEGVSGMSASKMRAHAQSGNFKEFKKGIPSHVKDEHAKELYDHVRQGMGLKEDLDLEFEMLLVEGVHDKSIFKAVFLFGGPGSGKDFVLSKTLDGHGLVEINSDKAFEFLMDKNNLDMRMPESETERRNVVRGKAKTMTELRQHLALFGRNGIIINGTGDDTEKIAKIKERLADLGYESQAIMVNTADEVSKQRNVERGQRGGRTVPEEIRKDKWDSVQKSRAEYAKMFGSDYMEFDNSEDLRSADPQVVQAKEKELLQLYKNVQKFVSKPPKNPSAQTWVASELEKKDTLKVDTKKEIVPHEGSKSAEEAKKLGLQYYGFGRYGMNGKVTHRSVHDKLVEVQPDQNKSTKMPVTGSSMSRTPSSKVTTTQKQKLQSIQSKSPLKKLSKTNEEFEMLSESIFSSGLANKLLSLGRDTQPFGEVQDAHTITNEDVKHKQEKYLEDKNGKVRVFMIRSAAAKESHLRNGEIVKMDKGYVVKLKENEDVCIPEKTVFFEDSSGNFNQNPRSTNVASGNGTKTGLITEGVTSLTTSSEYSRADNFDQETIGETQNKPRQKLTISQIRNKQKVQVKESIDKGIEPGVSMAGSGESPARDTGEKINKKGKATPVVTEEEQLDEMPGANMDTRRVHQHLKKQGWKLTRTSGGHDVYTHDKASHHISVPRHNKLKAPLVRGILKSSTQLNELTGDETTASIGDQKEDELKKKGISLTSFKKRNFV